jgi:hypothetical protein
MKRESSGETSDLTILYAGEDEDDFYGIEFENLERYTTKIKLDATGLMNDEHCDVRVIEPIGYAPALLIIENECTNLDGEVLNWPPPKYAMKETHALILKALVKLVS